MKRYTLVFYILMQSIACKDSSVIKDQKPQSSITAEHLLQDYNQRIINAAKQKSFEEVRNLYDQESLLMPDYNPLIVNDKNIEIYYDTIFARQDLKIYRRTTVDIIEFEHLIIEIGLFTKTFENSENLEGKYFNVWRKHGEEKLILRAEAFGYLKPIDNPLPFIVPTASKYDSKTISIPRELEAYISLSKDNVRARMPERTADSYTGDGMYLPFADTIKTGKNVLIAHYKNYYQYPATIDSIKLKTYALDLVEDGYINYGGFYVDWTVPGIIGTTEGTGISYWRREKDHSLRIHRQIGLHMYK